MQCPSRSCVSTVGQDALTVTGPDAVNALDRLTTLTGAASLSQAQQTQVVTESGTLLGTISQVVLDDEARTVVGYMLSTSLWKRMRHNAPRIAVQDVLRFGAAGIMIVADRVGVRLTSEAGGSAREAPRLRWLPSSLSDTSARSWCILKGYSWRSMSIQPMNESRWDQARPGRPHAGSSAADPASLAGCRLATGVAKGAFGSRPSSGGQCWPARDPSFQALLLSNEPPSSTKSTWSKYLPAPGFHVLLRQWVVERMFAWLLCNRRLSRDLLSGSAVVVPPARPGSISLAMIRLMLRRLVARMQ